MLTIRSTLCLFSASGVVGRFCRHVPDDSGTTLLASGAISTLRTIDTGGLILFRYPLGLGLLTGLLGDGRFRGICIISRRSGNMCTSNIPPGSRFTGFCRCVHSRGSVSIEGQLSTLTRCLGVGGGLTVFVVRIFLRTKFIAVSGNFVGRIGGPIGETLTSARMCGSHLRGVRTRGVFVCDPFSRLAG